jgi:hypothetical protein
VWESTASCKSRVLLKVDVLLRFEQGNPFSTARRHAPSPDPPGVRA